MGATRPSVCADKAQGGGTDWPALAARLAGRLPAERLESDARAQAEELCKCRFRTAAIACSGGADSLCLLLLLWAHFPPLRKQLGVLHFDHRIRGGQSAADAEFVKGVAASLGLSFRCEAWEHSRPDASEDEARRARMAFIHATDARFIFFGHNRSDVAENLLMRLGRGSSLDGLSGPRPVQCFGEPEFFVHIRPLMNLSGAEIREAMRECGISWREDSTNAGSDYTRNRIRHEVLPRLAEIMGRDWEAGIARSRIRIDEADRAIDALARHYTDRAKDGLDLTALRAEHRAVVRRALEQWFAAQGLRERIVPDILDHLIEQIAGRDCDVRKYRSLGFEARNGKLRRFVQTPETRPAQWGDRTLTLRAGDTIRLPDGASLSAEALQLDEGEALRLIGELRQKRDNLTVCLALSPTRPLEIRSRRRGDIYRPLGAPGRIRLSDAMKNHKIPVRERDLLPIVLVEGRPAWCPRIPPAEEFMLNASTIEAVRLTYRNNSTA